MGCPEFSMVCMPVLTGLDRSNNLVFLHVPDFRVMDLPDQPRPSRSHYAYGSSSCVLNQRRARRYGCHLEMIRIVRLVTMKSAHKGCASKEQLNLHV